MKKKPVKQSPQKYLPKSLEEKWQKKWADSKLNHFTLDTKKEPYYVLVELPYPSGDLHIGHWFTFVTPDVLARFKRMQGFNVFFPHGYDAFGLPAENAAIKRNIHPKDWTMSNIESMNKQFATMGTMMDWDSLTITCLPEYYRWNQWIFLKMYEKGLAYRGKKLANWCPNCQTVLANENVESGKCWRCGTEVVQKEVAQWFLKITEYAERLLWANPPSVDWPQSVREGQNNWIGKSEGARVEFEVEGYDEKIAVYTTRPDTLYGATFLVLAPEHEVTTALIQKMFKTDNLDQVQEYVTTATKKSEMERKENKEKTGVFSGLYATNPVMNEKIEVWIADYVLPGYGTGAIMAVPAHDERDFAFATKYNLPIRTVISNKSEQTDKDSARGSYGKGIDSNDSPNEPYTGEGSIVNSGDWNGWETPQTLPKVIKWLEEKGLGKREVQYHLRDWSVSRQRYWGTPVPMIHCNPPAGGCGVVPVPEKDLPVEVPYNVDYVPKGKAPLATNEEWLNVECPKCGGKAQREAETLDTFFDSSWYYYRYLSPHFTDGPFDTDRVKQLMPVNVYFGGGEHTLGHTLYARFFTKFFHDIGLVDFEEFAKRRVQHGIVLGTDNEKMSKSKGNVINPDAVVKDFGADAVRIYLCFMMPYEATGPWSTSAMAGMYRFLRRIWDLQHKVVPGSGKDGMTKEDVIKMHQTIQKVTEDMGLIKMNTAIAALMDWLNHLSRKEAVSKEEYEVLLKLLAPFAPHLSEELYQEFFGDAEFVSIHLQPWPEYDPALTVADTVTIAVQVNGKLRDTFEIDSSEARQKESIEALAKKREAVVRHLSGKTIKHVIYVPGKILNFVVVE